MNVADVAAECALAGFFFKFILKDTMYFFSFFVSRK